FQSLLFPMDLVSTILNKNTSNLHLQPIDSSRWIEKMDHFYVAFLLLSCLFTTLVVTLSLLHLYHVLRFISNERIQADLYYLVFMFPVTALCGVIGMFIPRAATFLYSCALVYQMLCLFVTISLLFNIFGGRKELSEHLRATETQINFRVPPLCCFSCLPSIEATERNVRRVEWMVFQSPLLRLVLEAANVVVFLELNHRQHLWFLFSQLLGLISMCVAFYGCYVLVPTTSEEVRKYRFVHIFRAVDVAQCLYTIQKFCFDFAATIDIIRGDDLLSPSAKAQFWTSFMLTWEMLFMSCLLTYLLRPSKTQLFDKYHLRYGSEAIVTYTNQNNNNNVDESKEEEIRHFDALTTR
ncbi:osta-1, partial [Pristionchus pacificus]